MFIYNWNFIYNCCVCRVWVFDCFYCVGYSYRTCCSCRYCCCSGRSCDSFLDILLLIPLSYCFRCSYCWSYNNLTALDVSMLQYSSEIIIKSIDWMLQLYYTIEKMPHIWRDIPSNAQKIDLLWLLFDNQRCIIIYDRRKFHNFQIRRVPFNRLKCGAVECSVALNPKRLPHTVKSIQWNFPLARAVTAILTINFAWTTRCAIFTLMNPDKL